MRWSKYAGWFGAGAGALGLWWLLGRKSAPAIAGMPTGGNMSVALYYQTMRDNIGFGSSTKTTPNEYARNVWTAQEKQFRARATTIARFISANPNSELAKKFGPSPDQFSRQQFLIYRPGHGVAGAMGPQPWGWYLTDEFGRPFEGWGYGGSPTAGLLPIVQTVLPLIPGIGTAGGAALGAAIAVGQGKSLKDIGLASARGALPPGATMAFDAGVAIASGHQLKDVALDVALTELEKRYPGSRDAFAQGQALYKQAK